MFYYLYERLKDVLEDKWEEFIYFYDNMYNLCKICSVWLVFFFFKLYDEFGFKIKNVINRFYFRNYKEKNCKIEFIVELFKEIYFDLNIMVAE